MRTLKRFLTACRYLTALPLPRSAEAGDLGRAAGWFPVVGFVVGGVLAGAALAVPRFAPPLVGAVFLVALWAGLTGGLHLDGLADTLDGLGGGWSRDEALAIMHDAGTGAYGVTGVVLILALKIAALASLPVDLAWRALLVAPVLGRIGPLVLARLCPPARGEGAGHAFALTVGPSALLVASGVGVVAALALVGPWGALLVLVAGVEAALFAGYLRRRIGGLTGDCLGALVETTEASTLGVTVVLAHRGLL